MKCKLKAAAWTAAIVTVCTANALGDAPLGVKNLRCEYKVDPVGIDVRKPRLSWELVSAERGVLQTGYEIRVAASEVELGKGKLIWESGKQSSDASIQVEYGGPPLVSPRIYLLQGGGGRHPWDFFHFGKVGHLGKGLFLNQGL